MIAIEERMELGNQNAEVGAFVNDRQDYRNVHGRSVSLMDDGKKRYPESGYWRHFSHAERDWRLLKARVASFGQTNRDGMAFSTEPTGTKWTISDSESA